MHSGPHTPTCAPCGSTSADNNMATRPALDRLLAHAVENGGVLVVNDAVRLELELALLETQ
jgi:DNA invertase Pin-like site-specific DNA recombinase